MICSKDQKQELAFLPGSFLQTINHSRVFSRKTLFLPQKVEVILSWFLCPKAKSFLFSLPVQNAEERENAKANSQINGQNFQKDQKIIVSMSLAYESKF